MAGEIQLNSTTMATESSGSITAELDTIRPNTTNGSLTLQGDSSDSGVTGLTIDSSGVVNTTTAKVTNIQATSGQSLTIKDEDGNAAITIGTDNTAAGYLSLNFGSYHGDSSGAGSGALTGNTLSDYEEGTYSPEYKTNGVSLSGVTYDVQVGYYIKTGSFVYVSIQLRYDVTGSFSATSGNLTVTLPFTCGSSGRGGGFRTLASAWQTNTPDSGYVVVGTDAIQLMDATTTLTNSNLYTSGTNRNFLNLHVIYPTS